jgi:hypothetical protein
VITRDRNAQKTQFNISIKLYVCEDKPFVVYIVEKDLSSAIGKNMRKRNAKTDGTIDHLNAT